MRSWPCAVSEKLGERLSEGGGVGGREEKRKRGKGRRRGR